MTDDDDSDDHTDYDIGLDDTDDDTDDDTGDDTDDDTDNETDDDKTGDTDDDSDDQRLWWRWHDDDTDDDTDDDSTTTPTTTYTRWGRLMFCRQIDRTMRWVYDIRKSPPSSTSDELTNWRWQCDDSGHPRSHQWITTLDWWTPEWFIRRFNPASDTGDNNSG